MPSSNGACAANIVDAFKRKGYTIKILTIYDSRSDDLFCLDITNLKVSFRNKLFGYCQDSNLLKIMLQRAKELNNQYNFDFVVSFFRPVETILCGYYLSKKLNIKHYPVFFDVIDIPSLGFVKNCILKKNFIRLVRKIEEQNPTYFCLKYYKNYFNSNNLNPICVGIPNLIHRNIGISSERKTIDLIYAGSFYPIIRNPSKVLSFLKFIIGTNIFLHLYSWGCDGVVSDYVKEYGGNLILHGKQNVETVGDALANANVLINISNDDDKAVPGKIIEYFSYGKPVINFYFRSDDPGMEEYEKYPLILNLSIDELDKEKEKTVLDFLNKNKNLTIRYSVIEGLFSDCTGEHLFNRIVDEKDELSEVF